MSFKFKNDGCDDDEDDYMGLRQALPVGPIPKDFDKSVPPTTGEEFIHHVLYEAKKFGSVLSAKKIDEAIRNARGGQIPKKIQIRRSDRGPSLHWQEEQVNQFASLRNRILRLRLKQSMCIPKISVPTVENSDQDWINFINSHKPQLTVLFAMRQNMLERALGSLSQLCLTIDQGAWVYAISANLDHPLSREACADLRDIARRCATSRDSTDDVDEETRNMINLLITIVVNYFQQIDLCEE